MNGWFLASYIALWVLVAVLAVALLALYNHFGQMYMSSREGRAAHGPAEGSALAPAEARDVLGTPVTIPVPGRDTLMVFTTTQCELCDELKPGLNRLARAHPECAVLVICGGEREPVERWGRDLPDPVLVPDRTSHIAARYGIGLLPFLVMTSETGVVVTRGIVNSEQDLELALAIGRGDETDVVRVHTPIGGTT
jgi:hypothetical protein